MENKLPMKEGQEKENQKEQPEDETVRAWPRKHGIVEYILALITLIILVMVFREQITGILQWIFQRALER